MRSTLHRLLPSDFPCLQRGGLETVQVNLGYLCNQSCVHCHVAAGPNRREVMERATVEEVLEFLGRATAAQLDLTGGAPELNPHFRYLVEAARKLGLRVLDRCNLTVLEEPGQEGLAEFLACNRVEIVASLPCYLEANVDRQRGRGVFETSILALRRLNALGYGLERSALSLSLVYNPQGPTLPPPQAALEADYRAHLRAEHGVEFTRLIALANMPIRRFGATLVETGAFDDYMDLLRRNHSRGNLQSVMCRSLISVDWQGYVYDCDFNQMLDLPLRLNGRRRLHLRDLTQEAIAGSPIRVGGHCYGCTAGQGSSCGGALSG